jgi:hypothetical protein
MMGWRALMSPGQETPGVAMRGPLVILVESVILGVMGAAFLVSGWYGLRLSTGENDPSYLPAEELAQRHRVLRGGMYACLASGSVLVVLALVLFCAVLVAEHRPHSPLYPGAR